MIPSIKTNLSRSIAYGTFPVSILSGLASAVLLTAAYLVSWLGWLIWIAFVPYIIAVRRSKRGQIYLATAFTVIPFLSLLTCLMGFSSLYDFEQQFNFSVPMTYLTISGIILALTVLTAEIQAVGRLFRRWDWVVIPLIWTGLLLLLKMLPFSAFRKLESVLSIIPISYPIFQCLAGRFLMYLLIPAVLLVNFLAAKILEFPGGRTKYTLLAVIGAGILACGVLGGPIRDIPSSSPVTQGVDSKKLLEMDKEIRETYPQIRSVIIVRHGYTIFEKYYHGCTPYSYIEVCSVTKSFIGALVGIAINKGLIENENQNFYDYFPEYKTSGVDPKAGEIRIKDLLALKSGFISTAAVADAIFASEDWVKNAVLRQVWLEPGRYFSYDSLSPHILSALVNRVSSRKGTEFADRYLFGPLGIHGYYWETDPKGNPYGGAGMFMKSRDLAKFGLLYLNKGTWNGKQVIPSRWVVASTQAHSGGGLPEFEQYGYLFWITETSGHKAFFAAGFGGEFIYVVPDLDMVVVIGSNAFDPHTENRNLVKEFILPSVTR